MTKFRDGLIGPTVILLSICFVMTLALAFTYQTTKPIIAKAESEAAERAKYEMIPGFETAVQITAALPNGVAEAYKTEAGYVFKSGSKGYNGTVTYMIGMDENGGVTSINMFESKETRGIGTKVGEQEYVENFFGDVDPDSVDAVTGATITTDSLKNSLKQARDAFEAVKGA